MKPETNRSLESRDFAIGVLSTTAVILFVGLLVIQTRPEPVWAAGMTATGGDYVLTVGQVGVADEEYVYVLDGPSAKLIAYRFDSGRQQIDVVQGIDLTELRSQEPDAAQQTTPTKRPGTPGRRP